MNKVNILRQIRQKPTNDLDREQNWNNRFHLGKLPEYNTMTDNNCNLFLIIKILA